MLKGKLLTVLDVKSFTTLSERVGTFHEKEPAEVVVLEKVSDKPELTEQVTVADAETPEPNTSSAKADSKEVPDSDSEPSEKPQSLKKDMARYLRSFGTLGFIAVFVLILLKVIADKGSGK